MNYLIGIDIGGTNIDIVAVNQSLEIIKSHKQIHDKNQNSSIMSAVKKLLEGDLRPQDCLGIHMGTTIAINALLEEKNLNKVGVIRLAGHLPEMPPAYHFPKSLRNKILTHHICLNAGFDYDKSPIGKISKAEILSHLENFHALGIQAIAVVGCFSPLYAEEEQMVQKIIHESIYNKMHISLSHELGGLGFLNRENNTIINASLQGVLNEALQELQCLLREYGFASKIHISQNNGCLMSLEEAIRFPIKTISSGPTNSIIGASKLAGLKDAIVVDIGGTSTDIGIIENHFPRYSLEAAKVAGIPTDFMLPDIQILALGGGSIIKKSGDTYQIGPESVGATILEKSLSYGGEILCLHDIRQVIDKKIVSKRIKLKEALTIIKESINIIKTSIQNLVNIDKYPIIFVGGGACLILEQHIENQMHKPKFFEVANAYGAALAEISGTIDEVHHLHQNRNQIMAILEKKAIKHAIHQGANPEKTRIIKKELLPFYYMDNQLTRIIITAAGPKVF